MMVANTVWQKTTFDKKYDIINDSTCISKSNEIDFVLNTTDKNIVFTASWGELITAFPGAAVVLENGTFGGNCAQTCDGRLY